MRMISIVVSVVLLAIYILIRISYPADEKIFGPLSVVVSTAALIVLLLHPHLRRCTDKIFGLIIFLFLCVIKFEVYLFPPYGDSASGPFMEAIWLLENNFNYIALSKEPGFVYGGAKVYLFSIYPTFQALLLKLIPNTNVFLIVNHLFVFIWGAIVVTFVRKIAREIFDSDLATLLAVFVMSLPLFHSQVEIINMEMPMTMFCVLAVYHAIKRRWALASFMAILAILVKGTAIGIGATVFAAAIFSYFMFREERRLKTLTWAMGICVFVLLFTYLNFFVLFEKGDVAMVGLFEGLKKMLHWPLIYVFLLSLIIFIIQSLREKRIHYPALVLFTASLSWIVVFMNSYGDQYRYRLFLAPFIWLCFAFVSDQILKSHRALMIVVTVGILIATVGSYGLFFKPFAYNQDAVLERTLEYRNDMRMEMRLARHVEENFSSFLIGAPFTVAQELAFPELGYVKKQLNVMIYDYPCRYNRITQFKNIRELNLKNTLWVGIQNDLGVLMPEMKGYPLSSMDHILAEIKEGERIGWLFMGGYMIEKMRLVQIEIIKYHSQRGLIRNIHEPNFGL